MRYYLGIDPGIHGALSLINDKDDVILQYVMPLEDGRIDTQMFKILIDKTTYHGEANVILEQPTVLFGVSKTSMAVMFETVGIVKGLLAGLDINYKVLNPKIWQNKIWIDEDRVLKKSKTGKKMVNDTKATSFNAAKRLFPDHDQWYYGDNEDNKGRRTKINDGLVDSLLIAKYCQLINK
jgi:hypothetical protein